MTGLLGVALSFIPVGDEFEKDIGLTWLFSVRGPIAPPPQVAVVAINERASSAIGLPALPRDWPRTIHATLIDNLVKRGATVVAFDVDFHRPKVAADDQAFARAVAKANRVALIELLTGKRQPIVDARGKDVGMVWMEQVVPPIPALARSASGLAPFPLPKVQTNVFEFWAFKSTANDVGTLPSVALQLFARDVDDQWRAALQDAGIESGAASPSHASAAAPAESLRQAMHRWRRALRNNPTARAKLEQAIERRSANPGDGNERRLLLALARLYGGPDHRLINFYGPPGTIPTIPYNAMITGSDPNVPPQLLDVKGKVVFVGFSDLYDPGQPDRFYTVFSDQNGVDLSGVEIAATGFANLLTDRSITPMDPAMTAGLVFLFGFVLAAGIYLLTAIVAVPLALVLTAGYVYLAQWAFSTHDYWFPLAVPVLVQFPIALFVGLLAQYLLERRQHRRMSRAVSFYLPEHVAKELVDKEIDPSALNKVVHGVCLATDMSGFTRLSQSMSPTELAQFMNDYFEALAAALKQHQVDVTEFHADTVMCAWTADSANTLDRRRPLLAALATMRAVEQFNASRPGIGLYARVGLDEGNFYLGHTGGGGRMGYSILGECANTASRLEGLNKVLGTHVLASDSAVENVQGLVLRPLGRFLLLGKTAPIGVVEVMGQADNASAAELSLCDRFAQALVAYNQQQWPRAREAFADLLAEFPEDGPSRFYLDRCRQLEVEPSTSDDPSVVVMTSKG